MDVIAAVDALPEAGVTISALQTLDALVPGEWTPTRSFDALVRELEPRAGDRLVAEVRQRAAALQAASPRYGQAVQVYTLVDSVDTMAAGAVAASKIGSLFGSLGFLEKYTPKPDTTQAIDAALKLIAELTSFGLVNGMPSTTPDGLAKFVVALSDYARYDLMRIAAWVVFDGLLPLGPDFVAKIAGTVKAAAASDLAGNAAFDQLASRMPGATAADKQAFVVSAVDATADWVNRFVAQNGLTQELVLDRIQGVLPVADGGLDYVAAALDATTNYFSHTGTLTVGRALARQSIDAIKDDVWDAYLARA